MLIRVLILIAIFLGLDVRTCLESSKTRLASTKSLSKAFCIYPKFAIANEGEHNAVVGLSRRVLSADFSRVIKPSSKRKIANANSRIVRTKFDKDIDEMIELRLGQLYRRANVYDFYPLELPGSKARWKSHKKEIELMDYYDYARRDLEKLNESKLLRVIKADFNLDSKPDYAIVVRNTKKKKTYLAIINYQEMLYLKPFAASYLEIMNNAKYPTTVVYKDGKKRKVLEAPSIRLVAFDGASTVLYFDKAAAKWHELRL